MFSKKKALDIFSIFTCSFGIGTVVVIIRDMIKQRDPVLPNPYALVCIGLLCLIFLSIAGYGYYKLYPSAGKHNVSNDDIEMDDIETNAGVASDGSDDIVRMI